MDEDLNLAIALSLSTFDGGAPSISTEKEEHCDGKADRLPDDESYALMVQMSEHEEAKRRDNSALCAKKVDADEVFALDLQRKIDEEEIMNGGGSGGGRIIGSMSRVFGSLGGMRPAAGTNNNNNNNNNFGALTTSRRCYVCDTVPFDGRYVSVTEKSATTTAAAAATTNNCTYYYCQPCMRCKVCGVPLHSQVHSHAHDPGGLYCFECQQHKFGLKCCICESVLVGRYLRHNFFDSEKYCLSHEQIEQRRRCTSCHRLEPAITTTTTTTAAAAAASSSSRGERHTRTTPFVDLPDERTVCLECLDTAVMTTDECTALFLAAVDFLETEMGLVIPPAMREVPVLAVDVLSLNEEQSRGSATHATRREGGGAAVATSQVRGLTLSRSGEMRHYSQGDLYFDHRRGGWSVAAPRLMHVDTVRREVTAVMVLYGLPRDLTSSILVHEALHVYFKLQRHFPTCLDSAAEEGLCQLVAHRYLVWMGSGDDDDDDDDDGGGGGDGGGVRGREVRIDNNDNHIERKLRGYFLHCIESDPSTVYGGGYILARNTVSALGFEESLRQLGETATLPSCL
jgi:hypothetical protein